ncbi:CLUMA_CG007183, isoform A [Clunio marinus]|uniref:CLUMA_CG007183, isoform A n=1 Tax=Clunio marinus TaxID=568069 RepID=A0A1J1I466_9DIPT|nr:CLUMA_CG007183, isoform A [Clunio marinus]
MGTYFKLTLNFLSILIRSLKRFRRGLRVSLNPQKEGKVRERQEDGVRNKTKFMLFLKSYDELRIKNMKATYDSMLLLRQSESNWQAEISFGHNSNEIY